ncbi:MAG: phosphoribosylformylglycinamidine cyclo-ligase [Elusimicrobia bacterium CG08_land_8_20_14_0_20_59_10]|nr:MAG: phosphoribosylformylglycinamidine cyclo-ligase [Elusimicrobia bacterium CG08_land_8_20_14_0_20_59_10]
MTTYKKSGVDVKLADRFTEFIQKRSRAIGGFAGLLPIEETGGKYSIVASTDGVGTKLKLAFLLDRHHTIGIDLVAMCVNDLLCCGARPMLFLDYYATGRLDLARSKKIINGILEGCRQGESLLLGGETAEMPGFYRPGEYDLAGFSVGIVKNSEILDGKKVRPGDALIGLPSTGFHSNGFSLIRKVLDDKKLLKKYAARLLTPTKIYVKDIKKLRAALRGQKQDLLALAHITGAGIPGNLPRVLPRHLGAVVYKDAWKTPAIMREIQKLGDIPEPDMWDSFNMGLGMIIVVRKTAGKTVLKTLKGSMLIGEVIKGKNEVVLR